MGGSIVAGAALGSALLPGALLALERLPLIKHKDLPRPHELARDVRNRSGVHRRRQRGDEPRVGAVVHDDVLAGGQELHRLDHVEHDELRVVALHERKDERVALRLGRSGYVHAPRGPSPARCLAASPPRDGARKVGRGGIQVCSGDGFVAQAHVHAAAVAHSPAVVMVQYPG